MFQLRAMAHARYLVEQTLISGRFAAEMNKGNRQRFFLAPGNTHGSSDSTGAGVPQTAIVHIPLSAVLPSYCLPTSKSADR